MYGLSERFGRKRFVKVAANPADSIGDLRGATTVRERLAKHGAMLSAQQPVEDLARDEGRECGDHRWFVEEAYETKAGIEKRRVDLADGESTGWVDGSRRRQQVKNHL
jgi:hypothetical protein